MQAVAHVATLARLAALAAVLALVALLGIRPAVDDPGVGARALGPLPACRYDDILTSPRGLDDWSTTLVDTILRVPKSYAPSDLVRVADLGVAGRGRIRQVVATDLQKLHQAAEKDDASVAVQSAYRSYADQKVVFDYWVSQAGYERALEISARPGHSEHQLGLAIDFRSEPGGSPFEGDWATTPAGKWMKAHAWEYGFVMSYPKGKMKVSCYDYEPWHYRYVGRRLAAKVHASGLTLREYLWAHFTTTVVPPPTPKPTARPAPSSTSSPSPSVPPSEAPTVAPATPPATATAVPATPSAAAPTAGPSAAPATQAPGVLEPLTADPIVLAGAGIALGTLVLGVLAMVRRGRSGVGL